MGDRRPKRVKRRISYHEVKWLLVPLHLGNLAKNPGGWTDPGISRKERICSVHKKSYGHSFPLPALIRSTYSQLQVPSLHNNDESKLKRTVRYFG